MNEMRETTEAEEVNRDKLIRPEEMPHMSTEQLVEMYRQGYQLDSLPIRRRARIPPRRRGILGSDSSDIDKIDNMSGMDIENLMCIDGKEVTGADVVKSVIAVMAGALIYYKLGKYEAKKLGWD